MVATRAAAAWLSWIAYTDSDLGTVSRTDFDATLKQIPAATDGPWRTVWGPVFNDGICVYAARSNSGQLAIAFRGTNPLDVEGLTENFIADADVDLVAWQYPLRLGAQITGGTNQALALAISGTDSSSPERSGLTLLDWLRTQENGTEGSILVTGHSLGGGLAVAAAMWLRDQLPRVGLSYTMYPITFAAPTVTDAVFYKEFTRAFRAYRPIKNTTDIVPLFWNKLESLLTTFGPENGQYPTLWDYSELLYGAIDVAPITESDYVPLGTTSETFTVPLVTIANGASDWLTEAQMMHSMQNTYFKYVIGRNGPNLPNSTAAIAAQGPALQGDTVPLASDGHAPELPSNDYAAMPAGDSNGEQGT